MRQYHRIQKQFYRICLVSERDSQTLALVPDIENAYMIEHLLRSSQKLREGQRIVSFPSVLRPDTESDTGAAVTDLGEVRRTKFDIT
ncbi:MAG: hypothetical protein A2342_03595 [Gallionellales bacterium RIFOXYB12_FULL_54_9]|nr:MAG: hypothetical protein A2342_03595 [Gallionellales bacterium RIFOXYB12_FULL_54_9]